jgi:hypothetical protein
MFVPDSISSFVNIAPTLSVCRCIPVCAEEEEEEEEEEEAELNCFGKCAKQTRKTASVKLTRKGLPD